MRTLGVLCLLGLATLARAGELATAEAAVQKVAKAVRPTVVTVITPNKRDFDLTGIVIGAGGVVLTVRSPLAGDAEPPSTVSVRYPGKRTTVEAELIDDDRETDTVLYKASGARARAISVARASDVSHGMWVLLFGNTFGQGREGTPTLSLGVISAVERDARGVRVFHSSAMVNPGSVGAPIVDLSGDLVGIAAPSITDDGQQTIVIPYDRIRHAYREKGGKGSKVVGRQTPPRRFRDHIADLLGPVLQDAARRGSRALVSVRALPLATDAPKKTETRKEEAKKGDPKAPKKRPARPPPRRVQGARPAYDCSSGLIVDADGLVLCPLRITGWPVAERKLDVDLLDGQTYSAKVLGKDERLRLVLLRIEAKGLPVLEPAPPESHRAGHLAIALGYPHARPKNTPQLTVGILSRTNALTMLHPAFAALQTDAAVSASNRGGPLVDIDGRLLGILLDVNDTEVVGYRSRKRGRFTGNAGLGFAVPWTTLKTLVPRLARGEVMKTGFLGVRTVEGKGGLNVVAVVEKNSKGDPSGARAAGIKKGDVILTIGGQKTLTTRDLRRVLGGLAAGDKVKIVVRRKGEQRELEVVLGER